MAVIRPRGVQENQRWESTELRRRLMADAWSADLDVHMAKHVDPAKLRAWGEPSKALNLFKSVISQLSVLYRETPLVTNPDLTPEAESYLLDTVRPFRYASKNNRDVIALRENLIHLAWSEGSTVSEPGISIRLVPPSQVVATAHPSRPSKPIRIEEAVERTDKLTGKKIGTWNVWDISDANTPYFRIEADDKNRTDLTDRYAPDMVGLYPYRHAQTGLPYLPWVLYHAEEQPCLWDPTAWSELVWGSMDAALLVSFTMHVAKDASHAQKYGIGVRLKGLTVKSEGKATRAEITTDPSSLLMFETLNPTGTGTVGTLAPASKPSELLQLTRDLISMLSANVGLSGTDIERTQAESGVAIQLRRDAVRRLQGEYTPQFRRGDTELLEKIALISNMWGAGKVPALPLAGYSITYPSLPLSREEMVELMAVRKEELALGVISIVDIMMERHPEMSRDDAIQRLIEIKQETQFLGALDTPPTTEVITNG